MKPRGSAARGGAAAALPRGSPWQRTWRSGVRRALARSSPPFAAWPTKRRLSRDFPLPPDFKDLLAVFATHSVEYLVVGGYAVGFHARLRFTKVIDLWVGNAPDNLMRVRASPEELGAPVAMLEQLEAALDEDVLWMEIPPVRIDIVKGVPGGDFATCLARGVSTSWDGVPVSVISLDDLIATTGKNSSSLGTLAMDGCLCTVLPFPLAKSDMLIGIPPGGRPWN
jgi:hypothetical protein